MSENPDMGHPPFDRQPLAGIQLRMPLSNGDAPLNRDQRGIVIAALVSLLHLSDGLALHA